MHCTCNETLCGAVSTVNLLNVWCDWKEKEEVKVGRCVCFPILEAQFCLYCCRTEALAKVRLFVDEDFGGDHVSKRHEHLQYVLVSKLLGQVVYEEVGPFRTWRDNKQIKGQTGFHLSDTAGEEALHCVDWHWCAVVIGTELKHTA